MYSSQIVLTYGDDKTERISLENLKIKNWETNGKKINEVINNIRKAGYKISTSNAGGGDGVFISSYLFVKEE